MEDHEIIELYWERREEAIKETSNKYGNLCTWIAGKILSSKMDQEECVNDVYLTVWNTIPVARPDRFPAFISKITRNLALKKYEYISASKRNPSVLFCLEELEGCVSGRESIESEMEIRQIVRAINTFLWQQEEEKRMVFLWRYWYFESIKTICNRTGFSISKVKSMLYEMRRKLRKQLEKEGFEI